MNTNLEMEDNGKEVSMWIVRWMQGVRWPLLLLSIIFLTISTVFFFAGRFWPWGWAVGMVLMFFSGKSDSEKKGYRF